MADSANFSTQASTLAIEQGKAQTLGLIAQALQNAFPLSAYTGKFTCTAAATTSVTDAHCKATSVVIPFQANAAAATLQGSAKCLYPTAGNGSFTVTTASGGSAAGTEIFNYLIVNTGT